MHRAFACGTLLLTLAGTANCQPSQTRYPRNGFVPDARTAVSIAKAVGIPLFGAGSVKAKAFRAKLKAGVWTVYGTPTDGAGDEAVITISKKSGAILRAALAVVVRVQRPTKGRA